MNYASRIQRAAYFHCPQPIKNLLATAYGTAQQRARYGQSFHHWKEFLDESQHWDNEALRAYQERQLENFWTAIETTPYYAQRAQYRRCCRVAELVNLPLLSKADVRERQAQLQNPRFKRQDVRWAHTSGTTGKSIHFPISLDCFQREYAFRSLHYSWSGCDIPSGKRIAVCQGHPVTHPDRKTPPFWVEDSANHSLILSSYHLSRHNLPAYVRKLEEFEPALLLGYPSSLCLLAWAYRDTGRKMQFLCASYTTSETLLDWQRDLIETAFQCGVFDWYGNSEMCSNIVQCEHGLRHLKLEHSICEVLDDDGLPVAPGGIGSLVCTGFGNHAFPLVRYQVGDVVKLSRSEKCECGRGGILVDQIIGRIEDYIVAGDGRVVGRLDHLFKDSQNVVEAQVVQTTPGEVTLRIVRGPGFGKSDITAIETEAVLRLGSETIVRFEFVPSIPRTANGKFRFIESSLTREDLQHAFCQPLSERIS